MTRIAVIAYDIACDRRRRAVHRALWRWRIDGQYSLHECVLSPLQAEQLFIQLAAMIDPLADRLLLVWIERTSTLHYPSASAATAGRPTTVRRTTPGLLRIFR